MRDWDDHRLILALHRNGTLRATGEALGVTHTTIARRLAVLNDKEPMPLFIRQDGAYRVTDYGRERAALAERIEALDHSATRIQRSADGGAQANLGVLPWPCVLQYTLDGVATDQVRSNGLWYLALEAIHVRARIR